MSKPEWVSVGEDKLGSTCMSVYFSDAIDSPFISILRGKTLWSAFISIPYKNGERVTFDIPGDISMDEAWDMAKEKAVELLAKHMELLKEKEMKKFDSLIQGINNCL